MSDKQAEVKGHEYLPQGKHLICSCGLYYDIGENRIIGSKEQHAAHLAALASQPEHRETVCAVHHVHLCGICFPGALASQVPAQPPAQTTEKCGAPAAPFIPRRGMSWACVLPKGHDGEHLRGGSCFKHGEYIGENCPKWPDCTAPVPAQGTTPAYWLVLYEDADQRPMLFTEEKAARKYYADAKLNWNCHLFCQVESSPAPASPQVGETLEQEVDDLMTELGAWDSEPCYQRATKAVTAFVREKLRAALLVSGDKKVTLLNEDTLLAQEYEYTQPGEAPITANVGGWYSSAVYWRHQTIRLRAALAEADKRLAEQKREFDAANKYTSHELHLVYQDAWAEALEEAAKVAMAYKTEYLSTSCGIAFKIRALAAQPTPAPKEQANGGGE